MVAVDTNILVYAHVSRLPMHAAAAAALNDLAAGGKPWAIPWSCLHEFYSVMTSSRAFKGAVGPEEVFQAIDALRRSRGLRLLAEGPEHLAILRKLLIASGATGGAVYDARIAAVCIEHDVEEIWTADRDFLRYPGLRVRNPLLA